MPLSQHHAGCLRRTRMLGRAILWHPDTRRLSEHLLEALPKSLTMNRRNLLRSLTFAVVAAAIDIRAAVPVRITVARFNPVEYRGIVWLGDSFSNQWSWTGFNPCRRIEA